SPRHAAEPGGHHRARLRHHGRSGADRTLRTDRTRPPDAALRGRDEHVDLLPAVAAPPESARAGLDLHALAGARRHGALPGGVPTREGRPIHRPAHARPGHLADHRRGGDRGDGPHVPPAARRGRRLPSGGSTLTVLHASDLQIGKPYRAWAAEALVRTAEEVTPDLVVIAGDLTQRAKPREYRLAREVLSHFGETPVVVTPGNHDVPVYRVWERLFAPYRNW